MPAQTYDEVQAQRATSSSKTTAKSKPSSKAKSHTNTSKESPVGSDDEPFYDAKDTANVESVTVKKAEKIRTEYIERRPKYTAKQGGVIRGHATNIAGVDLRAITGALAASKAKPTPENIIHVHREALKANMEYGRDYEAIQEPKFLKGNGYNVAGVGANPYGPEPESPIDSADVNSDHESI